MSSIIDALLDPNVPFLRFALLAGLMGSVAFGMIGSFVVVRRISYIAGAISHSALGGIGLGLYLRNAQGWTWLDPMFGALVVALLSAIVIGLVSLHGKQREDTVIGAIWAVGMAVGLLFLSITPGYSDPMAYLFGNILLISASDLWLMLFLDVLIVGAVLLFYNKFLAICFDDEFAAVRGLYVEALYLFLLCLIALTVVLMISVVGTVLVIALLTLPAAVAGQYSSRLWKMMVIAVVLCGLFTMTGLGVSYQFDVPSGPMIILIAGAVYFISTFVVRRKT